MISQTWIIGKAIRALFADRVTYIYIICNMLPNAMLTESMNAYCTCTMYFVFDLLILSVYAT